MSRRPAQAFEALEIPLQSLPFHETSLASTEQQTYPSIFPHLLDCFAAALLDPDAAHDDLRAAFYPSLQNWAYTPEALRSHKALLGVIDLAGTVLPRIRYELAAQPSGVPVCGYVPNEYTYKDASQTTFNHGRFPTIRLTIYTSERVRFSRDVLY